MTGMPNHVDPGDAFRLAYLKTVLDRMEADPEEDKRVRALARRQLELQRAKRTSGPAFQAIWEDLLAKPVPVLKQLLLQDTRESAELRHAHMFAGVMSAREMNALRAEVRLRSRKPASKD